jgi:hypothetical protein
MDSKANNYNPEATEDTVPSSCTYDPEPEPGDNDQLKSEIKDLANEVKGLIGQANAKMDQANAKTDQIIVKTDQIT